MAAANPPQDASAYMHRLESLLNLAACLDDDTSTADDAARISEGEFSRVFGKLLLSAFPEEPGRSDSASSYLHAVSTIRPESATSGGIHEVADLNAALDAAHQKIQAYHDANIEVLAPDAGQALTQNFIDQWTRLGLAQTCPRPVGQFTYQNQTSIELMDRAALDLAESGRIHVPEILTGLAKIARSL